MFSGIPQVSGSILFLIYIIDLDDNITSNILKFADYAEVFRTVNKDGDKRHLQNDCKNDRCYSNVNAYT